MAISYYNKALKLINNKPSINQMSEQGYQAYVYPQPTIDYACKVLNARELKLYLQIGGQANGFNGAMKFYSDKAHIKSNHYSEVLESLVKKGFINHKNYESLEVLFPTESTESQNGNITDTRPATLPKRESSTQKGNTEEQKGNNDSQSCGYNRETEINKETLTTREKESLEELEQAINGISKIYNNKELLIRQVRDLRKQGFSYEFIFRGIENKDFEYFEKGINLLFYEPYQEEIYKIMEEFRKAEEEIEKTKLADLI